MTLETNESLFAVLTAANYCGYDVELGVSDPVREQVRADVVKVVQSSAETVETAKLMCQYYEERQQADSSRTLAQYVSLALYLTRPPELALKVKEADLPPDASAVLGILPLIQKFYTQADIHTIWLRHAAAYEALSNRYHAPLSKMMFETEIYLKLPSAGYLGRAFTVYIDPMGAPGQTNARNYGADYFTVISPGTGTSLKMDQLRHTFLHYLLDPMALKYPIALKRLQPLLFSVKTAPLDESFKNDTALLVTECLIRAIELRAPGSVKMTDVQREEILEKSTKQGFILTRYFYEALPEFEKDPAGLRNLFADLLNKIDLGKEERRASQIQFDAKTDPELLHLSRPMSNKLLVAAEQKLSSGDKEGAQKLAQQALDEHHEDPGRALFILAEVATMSSDMEGARGYFLQALGATHEAKVVAWSHIYLGRIFDLQENREAAVGHYKAALSATDTPPEAKAAAERGLQQAYEPPSRPQ